MHRLFIAIDFPEEIVKALSSLCFGVPGARWVRAEQLHLTLRFIGEVEGSFYKEIKEGLKDVTENSFSIHLNALGHFPPRKTPRVLWAGVEKNGPLVHLRNRINSVLFGLGLEPEKRKYSPHITIARLNNTHISKVADYLAINGLFDTNPFTVSKFSLYSSVLTPNGAIHKIEADYYLNKCLSIKGTN